MDEPLDEPGEVASPGVPVVAAPVVVWPAAVLLESQPGRDERGVGICGDVDRRRQQRNPGHPIRVQSREQVRQRPAEGVADQDSRRLVGCGGIKHGEGVSEQLGDRVGRGVERLTRSAAAAEVVGDDAGDAGQLRQLPIPHPAVDDLEAGQQQDGRPAAAFGPVADPHPVANELSCGHVILL